MSSQDISVGSDWYIDIKEHLNDATVGIIFLTPENINSPWLNFESGALSVSLNESKKVIPLIFGEETIETVLSSSPLKHFQSVLYPTKEGFHDLLMGLNDMLPRSINQEVFEKTFELWWPDLEEKLNRADRKYSLSKSKSTDNESSVLDDKAVLAQLDKKMDLIIRRDNVASNRLSKVPKVVIVDLRDALTDLGNLVSQFTEEVDDNYTVELKRIYRQFEKPIMFLKHNNLEVNRHLND